MKVFIGGYLWGIAFTVIFYIVFPLVIAGRPLEFTERVVLAMARQGLVVGLVFAIVFYLIAAVTRRVRERREYEEAMRKYIEKRMNDDVQV